MLKTHWHKNSFLTARYFSVNKMLFSNHEHKTGPKITFNSLKIKCAVSLKKCWSFLVTLFLFLNGSYQFKRWKVSVLFEYKWFNQGYELHKRRWVLKKFIWWSSLHDEALCDDMSKNDSHSRIKVKRETQATDKNAISFSVYRRLSRYVGLSVNMKWDFCDLLILFHFITF